MLMLMLMLMLLMLMLNALDSLACDTIKAIISPNGYDSAPSATQLRLVVFVYKLKVVHLGYLLELYIQSAFNENHSPL